MSGSSSPPESDAELLIRSRARKHNEQLGHEQTYLDEKPGESNHPSLRAERGHVEEAHGWDLINPESKFDELFDMLGGRQGG